MRYRYSPLPLLRCFVCVALASCAHSSGGSTASLPGSVTSQNMLPPLADSAMRRHVPQFVAEPLPKNFVPVAIMSDGRMPGSINGAAAFYRNGKLTIFGRYRNQATFMLSVNKYGEGAGYSQDANYATTPLEFVDGKIKALELVADSPQGDIAVAINSKGDIYGEGWQLGETDAANILRYAPGEPSLVQGQAGIARGVAVAVNDRGTLITSQYFFASDIWQACRGSGLNVAPILPQYPWTSAAWINDAGTIVGSIDETDTSPPWLPKTAYEFSRSGKLRILPSLPNTNDMEPKGINNAGQVVGYEALHNHLFWYQSGVMYDIAHAITPAISGIPVEGLSDDGEFVVQANAATYYLIKRNGRDTPGE